MSADVKIRVARIQDFDLATVANNGETLQLVRFSLPDGSHSPWLGFGTGQFSDLLAAMKDRQLAALEHDLTP